ncbi:hypothetical protein JCM14076_11560 [Methylosoma difficile]
MKALCLLLITANIGFFMWELNNGNGRPKALKPTIEMAGGEPILLVREKASKRTINTMPPPKPITIAPSYPYLSLPTTKLDP